MEIYDKNGNEKDWDWLREQFGDVKVEGAGAWRVQALREVIGPATVVVHLFDEDGADVAGQIVSWNWPEDQYQEATNNDGDVGFAMGGGAYYRPPAGGPHWIFVGDGSDSQTVSGLGMIGGTNHRHLDVVYQRGIVPNGNVKDALESFLRGAISEAEKALDILSA